MGDCRRLWETVGDCKRLWETVGDCKRLWETVGDYGRLYRQFRTVYIEPYKIVLDLVLCNTK